IELAGEAGVAGAGDRLGRVVDRVGESGARRQVVPGERRLVAGEDDAGDERREGRVRRSVARERLAVLTIEADAEVERAAPFRNRFAGIEIEGATLDGAARLEAQLRARHRRLLRQLEDPVAGPQRRGRRIYAAIPDAVL